MQITIIEDAQQAVAFLQPQLLRINTEIEMMVYPSFDYTRLMFVNSDGDMWDIGTVFYSGDVAGAARFLSGKGHDMPFADISTEQHLQTNHLAGIGYEWSLQELQRAGRNGRNLGTEKAAAARKVAEAFIYNNAIRGSTEKNTEGLINSALVPQAVLPADGTGSATTLASKTPEQVLRDTNAALNAPFNATKETHMADTLMLPSTVVQGLAIRTMGTASDMTVLKFLKENNSYTLETGQPLTIIGHRELETAGAGSTGRMMAYDSDRGVVQFHLPGPHEFLPAFQKAAVSWEVAGLMNIGGVEFRRPLGAAYRDGV